MAFRSATESNFWRLFGDLGPVIWLSRAKSRVLAVGLRNRRSEVRILSGALDFRLVAGVSLILTFVLWTEGLVPEAAHS
jgi:hypothetical protein